MPRRPLPVDTRWNSVTDSSEYFTTHWSNISLIFEKTLGPQDTLYRFMEHIQIKRSAQDLLSILKPVGIALDKLQSDGVYLGDVVEIWFQLRSVFLEEYLPKIATRSSLQLVFYAANLLDHRYQGFNLDHAELRKAMEYIKECRNDVAPEVSKYLAKMAPYSPCLFADNYNSVSPCLVDCSWNEYIR